MISWPNFLSQLLNGLALGALLALISSGLTIIYGTLGVLNLAHGAMFMLGGYAGYVAFQATDSFIVAVVVGTAFLLVVGFLTERIVIRHFYDRPHEHQLLVTFGLGICFVEIGRLTFGSQSLTVPPPALFSGITPLGVINFAHGALFVVGAYAGLTTYAATQSFVLAIVAGSAVALAVGLLMERGIVRLYYQRPPEDQLLVTFGIGIVLVEAVRATYGGLALTVPQPSWGQGIVPMGFLIYPLYRMEILVISALTLAVLYVVLYRTRLGLIVRAGIEDSTMVDSLGINVSRVFMVVFGIGAMAAGFAGIVNAPIVSLTPDVGESILVQTFVVVVIGGVGSFPGAVLGGLIAGEIVSITSMINPGYAYVMLFAAMTLVLMVRPRGLLGVRGRE